MIFYLSIITSLGLLSFAYQKFLPKNKILSFVLCTIILTVPSVIAGMRDNSVGVDIRVYERWLFQLALRSNNLWEYFQASNSDFFFCVINYIAASISDRIGVAFFLIEFTMLTFAFAACHRMREIVPMWISFTAFLLGYYVLSFNIMRQCIAISFLTLGYTYLLKDNKIKTFLKYLIVSFFFHKTAVIGGTFLLAIQIIVNSKKTSTKVILSTLYVFCCIIVVVIFRILLNLLANLGGRFASYVVYGGEVGVFKPYTSTTLVLGEFLCIVAAIFYLSKGLITKRIAHTYILLLSTSLMSEYLGLYTTYATRLDMYFCALQPFFLPHFALCPGIGTKTRFLFSGLAIFIFLVIWMKFVVDTGDAFPYHSEIIGI